MDRLLILIVVVLLVIVVLACLSGWNSNTPGKLSRFPSQASHYSEGENFLSQTVPTAIFELYRQASTAFEGYGLRVGYKFHKTGIIWEFYVTGHKINFDDWMQCYRAMFPYGHDFVMPTLKHYEDIFYISMEVSEDTYSHEYIEQLHVCLNSHGKPKYEYTLKPDGVFSFRCETPHNVKTRGRGKGNQLARDAIQEGFEPTTAVALMKWVEEQGWHGVSYGFLKKSHQVGLYVYQPDMPTLKSYFQTLHPNFSGISDNMLGKIRELVVYFEGTPSNAAIVQDSFYVEV